MEFEWDEKKGASNFEKHAVSFDEAVTVFCDPFANIFFDEFHSEQEHREIIVGHSKSGRLLLVCFVEKRRRHVRIISARLATKRERTEYEKNSESKNRSR